MMEGKAQHCEFSAAIVGYLYGETTEHERDLFEEHLVSCSACTDEFAEAAQSRFSVYEWQRDEFAPMATPSFVIPYDQPRTGFFVGLRETLSGGWAAPAFAFAAIAIVAGLAVVFGGGGSSNQTVVSVEPPRQMETGPFINEGRPGSPTLPQKVKVIAATATAPVSRKQATQSVRAVNVERRAIPRAPQRTVQARSTVTQRAPVLSSEVQADDDTSLRLSDLFDSEGT